MENENLNILFNKYCHAECSADEIVTLLQYFNLDKDQDKLKSLIIQQLETSASEDHFIHAQRAFEKTDRALLLMFAKERKNKPVFKFFRAMTAAAVLLAMLSIGYLLMKPYNGSFSEAKIAATADIAPGGTNAILKIAGTKEVIPLSQDKKGLYIRNGVMYYKGHLGVTDPVLDGKEKVTGSNYTIETPRGGQYQVVLSDGTEVWLNAASSLTYPASFEGNTREVFVTGEVFFHVAKNKLKPFIVNAGEVKNIVTGTSFNVSAYDDEQDVKTTLVTGGVKVSRKQEEALLKPGQQATVSNHSLKVKAVDVSEYTAWINDEFSLENKDIQTIMKSISRWYNVDVYYQGTGFDSRKFGGTYTRTKGLKALLNHLENLSGIRFQIEGRRVKVIL